MTQPVNPQNLHSPAEDPALNQAFSGAGVLVFAGIPLPPVLERRDDAAIVVRGRRVSLYLVLRHYLEGFKADELHQRFPSVARHEIEELIAFYHQHRDACQEYLQECEARLSQLEQSAGTGPSLAELRARQQQ
jgi:uncharacterized protein (DUF433 family)